MSALELKNGDSATFSLGVTLNHDGTAERLAGLQSVTINGVEFVRRDTSQKKIELARKYGAWTALGDLQEVLQEFAETVPGLNGDTVHLDEYRSVRSLYSWTIERLGQIRREALK
jgi:hypothetical protein